MMGVADSAADAGLLFQCTLVLLEPLGVAEGVAFSLPVSQLLQTLACCSTAVCAHCPLALQRPGVPRSHCPQVVLPTGGPALRLLETPSLATAQGRYLYDLQLSRAKSLLNKSGRSLG
jgi:hypothetical protein